MASIDQPHAAPPPSDAMDAAGLERSADRGDANALFELGSRLLVGNGAAFESRQAVSRLAAAAEKNHAEALRLMATLAGTGALGPQRWSAALSYLARAAAAGSDHARGQIQVLSGAAPVDDRLDAWRRACDAVDVDAWTDSPARRQLWEAPRVRMAEGFATAAVCDWLRQRASGRFRPAMMYDGAIKAEQLDPHRTCSDYEFDILNTDVVLLLVRERIAALTKLPAVAMEPPRIFHYALGQEIKPHYDRCGDGVAGYGHDGGYRGDRIVTFLLYLNDGYEGGDLDFPKAGFRCKGAKGDAVYFAHIDPAGKPDPLSLHAGLPIRRGEKWVLSQWIHDRPFGVAEPDR